ncbi:MAG: glycosyltransferase family 4 protein [Nanoarchaeota archaeon]|nr:glycosyltransferase family 4 protein [Nanoarchaeota archaeon]
MKTRIIVADTAKLTPPLWGGPIRIFNLYKNLSKRFDITYVGINCRRDAKKYEKRIAENFKEIEIPVTKLYYPVKWIELYLFKHLTFDLFTYLLMKLDINFKRELNKESDIIIASHVWSAPCFKKKKNQIMVYDAHNCEYLLIKKILKNILFKNLISYWVKIVEKNACKKSDVILACSEEDKSHFIKLYGIAPEKIYIIPNGANIKPLPNQKDQKKAKKELSIKKAIFFVGAFYNPNIEAVNFIIKNVALKLKKYDFLIVGSVCNAFLEKDLPENVKLYGQVSNKRLDKLMIASDIAINPIFNGSGINIKLLDYFSNGLPVITTKFGARGIEAEHGKDFIVSRPEDFTNNIKMLFNNKKLREKLKKNGRKIAKKTYDWKIISKNLEEILKKVKNE